MGNITSYFVPISSTTPVKPKKPARERKTFTPAIAPSPTVIDMKNEKVPSEADKKLTFTKLPNNIFSEYTCSNNVSTDKELNQFLATVILAYSKHLDLHVSPDDFLIAVDAIVTKYVNENAEKLRTLFVDHEGKKSLIIEADDEPARFLLNDLTPNWTNCIEEWCEMMQDSIKDNTFMSAELADFSTSSVLDHRITQSFVMDTVQNYFKYIVRTRCGIPKVIMHGSENDWMRLREKILTLSKFFNDFEPNNNLSSYLSTTILDNVDSLITTFKEATNPSEDTVSFWCRIFSKEENYGSGAKYYYDGWILDFFPTYSNEIGYKVDTTLATFTNGKTTTPVVWRKEGIDFPYFLEAGFHGIQQHEDGSVEVIKGLTVKPLF